MAQIIDLNNRRIHRKDGASSSCPWEFRQANWNAKHFVQMLRSHASGLRQDPGPLPPHFPLLNGMQSTIKGVFAHRKREDRMRDVYLLAGLIDCMINQVNPILRTVLLRDMYKKVFKMKKALGITWYGPLDHVLLPIDPRLYDVCKYSDGLAAAGNMKTLYGKIREGTNEMFDILSAHYIFFFPNTGA